MPVLVRGSRVSTASSAWVPPVEVPMATTLSVVLCSALPAPAPGRAASMASAPSLGRGTVIRTRPMLARAAARTAVTKSSPASCKNCFTPSLGLVMMLSAPAASASMVVAAPSSVSEEHTTTGVGRSAMIFFRKAIPSMRGISMSVTITSGHCTRIFSSAATGSGQAASTSMSLSRARVSRFTWRTTAESSTTMTLIFATATTPCPAPAAGGKWWDARAAPCC